MKKKTKATEERNKLKDFRNFLYVIWKHLRLPRPTDIQFDIADFLQSNERRLVVQAYRGCGKSWITSAYVLHQLYLNPQLNILVVSASKSRSDDFSTFCLRLLHEVDILQHLIPTEEQRQSKISFDVRPARASHAPSVKSLGITSQLSGARADIIISDDCEVPNNSATQGMREKLSEAIKEFESIIKPDTGRIIFLGTPQHAQSLYSQLGERGYKTRIWTARYPKEKQLLGYGDSLAPLLKKNLKQNKLLEGQPTDPDRFDDSDLSERELSYGRSGFALQFMLDTNLSDMERYPLKLQDLVVMNCNPEKAPEKIVWATSPELRCENVPNVGMNGDHFYRPMQLQGSWLEYQGACMAIDPSGRGKDETAYAIIKMLNGNLFVLAANGLKGGYEKETLQRLADLAKQHKVKHVIIESNFGDGMFQTLLTPYMQRTYPVTMEEVRHSTQKEKRICDVLEPLCNQHRLIFDEKVILDDYNSTQDRPPEQMLKYMLFYQFANITRDKGALKHDDRLDCLSMAAQYWVDQLGRDQDRAVLDRKNELFDQQLENFMENAISLTKEKKSNETTWINLS